MTKKKKKNASESKTNPKHMEKMKVNAGISTFKQGNGQLAVTDS